jgi:hypothetical protein
MSAGCIVSLTTAINWDLNCSRFTSLRSVILLAIDAAINQVLDASAQLFMKNKVVDSGILLDVQKGYFGRNKVADSNTSHL